MIVMSNCLVIDHQQTLAIQRVYVSPGVLTKHFIHPQVRSLRPRQHFQTCMESTCVNLGEARGSIELVLYIEHGLDISSVIQPWYSMFWP